MKDDKKVPQLRFPEFTDAWKQRKLSDISEKITEKNTELKEQETLTNSAELGIISQSDFFDHRISNESNINNYYVVSPNDFVYNPRISVTAPVGPINRNKLKRTGIMSPLYTVFKTHDVDCSFLEFFFKSSSWHKFMHFNGDSGARSDRFSIKDNVFFTMPIFVPSLSEQVKIGELLSKLDNTITLQQRKLNSLQKLKKGLLQKMFPKNGENIPEIRFPEFSDAWKQRKLREVIKEFYNGQTPYRQNKDYWGGNINWLTSGDLNRGVVTNTIEKITEEGKKASRLRIIPKGTLVIAIMGLEAAGTRGNCCILGIETTINQACMALIANESLATQSFLFQWYKSFGNSLALKYTQGTKQQNYNEELLGNLDISYPSLKEQQKIGSFFTQLDNTITLQQRKLESLQKLKKGLLQQMFI